MTDFPETTCRPSEQINLDILYGYEAGRRDAYREAAEGLKMSQATIRLHAGEMTAQEMRAVQAVLNWKAGEFEEKSHG